MQSEASRPLGDLRDLYATPLKLDFGSDIDIGESRYHYLLIQNLTHVPAAVRIRLDTFQALSTVQLTPASLPTTAKGTRGKGERSVPKLGI